MTTRNTKTPAMVLQELAVKKNYAPPTYEIIYSVTGSHENRFDYRVTIAGVVATGTGPSKQISKHNAAHNALMALKECGIYDPAENPCQEFNAPLTNVPASPLSPFKAPNCVGPLKDMCMEHKIPDPIFTMISDVGPPHSREFTYECKIASITTSAKGSTKKMAKQLAAKDMLDRIKDILPEIAAELIPQEDLKAISDLNNRAIEIYNKFYGQIIPNKTVKMDDYSRTLYKHMTENNLTYDDFREDLIEPTEESLKLILNKLGLNYNIYNMQENPHMVSLSLNTDTPFTTIGVSNSTDGALSEAIKMAFPIIDLALSRQC